MPLKGVIFDWDGVVINSALLHEKSWEVLAKELALKLPPNHFKTPPKASLMPPLPEKPGIAL